MHDLRLSTRSQYVSLSSWPYVEDGLAKGLSLQRVLSGFVQGPLSQPHCPYRHLWGTGREAEHSFVLCPNLIISCSLGSRTATQKSRASFRGGGGGGGGGEGGHSIPLGSFVHPLGFQPFKIEYRSRYARPHPKMSSNVLLPPPLGDFPK